MLVAVQILETCQRSSFAFQYCAGVADGFIFTEVLEIAGAITIWSHLSIADALT